MEGRVCCLIGQRKIEKSIELTQRVRDVIKDLIEKGVNDFLFVGYSELYVDVITLSLFRLREM